MMDRRFFIVGSPRSGTTLLQAMLDAHPEVAVVPETHFMRLLWARRADYDIGEESAWVRLIDDAFDLPSSSVLHVSRSDVREAADRHGRTVEAVFKGILDAYRMKRGASIVGEKTPGHVHYLADLARIFPGAKFVNLVRDPRAVVASLKAVPWARDSLTGNIMIWWRSVRAALEASPDIRSAMIDVRYEDLVGNPERALSRISSFLEIELHPAMREHHRKQLDVADVGREPWKRMAGQPVTTASLERWRTELRPEEILEIEQRTWREMSRYGYATHTAAWRLLPGAAAVSVRRQIARALRRRRSPLPNTGGRGD